MALGTDAKIELIKAAPLFENCSKQELQQIARIADELDIRAGKVLIREGERGREFFVIISGEVEVRRKGRKMATLGPGSFVGEMALLSKIPRMATVTAMTPLDVLVITDRAFLDLLEKTPTIAVKVARTLAERVAATSSATSSTAADRLVAAVDPRVRELAQRRTSPRSRCSSARATAMTHVMWVDADDDHVLINTEVHRAKFKAIERDPRVTVMIWERDDPTATSRCVDASSRQCVGRRLARTSTRSRESTAAGTTTRRTSSRSA